VNATKYYLVFACACSLAVAAGRAAAAADADAFDGAVDTYRGRVVYLDFWASWCAPCRQSFPWMQAMQDAYAQQGLTIIAVNLDANRADADRFLQQYKPQFSVRYDSRGAAAGRYKIPGMPTSIIIDRHGVTRFTHVGFRPVDRAEYESELRELLAEN
jgi:cytochrome c biogenesis protein CcmG/thiol:disulfide interchange protein DsbE